MKKIILSIAALVTASAIATAGPRVVELNIAKVPTNAAATVASAVTTNDTSSIGYVNGLYFNFGGYASPTCDVDVVVVGALGSIERTLFSADSLAADAEHYVRTGLKSTAGAAITDSNDKIPLFAGDRLVLRAYDANVTNAITLEAFIYIDDTP